MASTKNSLHGVPWRSTAFRGGAQGRIRTTDTRIFSPLLYQLSYLGDLVFFSLSYCFCLGEEILIFCGGASPPTPPERGTPRCVFLVLATTLCASF